VSRICDVTVRMRIYFPYIFVQPVCGGIKSRSEVFKTGRWIEAICCLLFAEVGTKGERQRTRERERDRVWREGERESGRERLQERVKKTCTACTFWREREREGERGREKARERQSERDSDSEREVNAAMHAYFDVNLKKCKGTKFSRCSAIVIPSTNYDVFSLQSMRLTFIFAHIQ